MYIMSDFDDPHQVACCGLVTHGVGSNSSCLPGKEELFLAVEIGAESFVCLPGKEELFLAVEIGAERVMCLPTWQGGTVPCCGDRS